MGRLAPRVGGPGRPVSRSSVRLGGVGMPGSGGTGLSGGWAAGRLEARGVALAKRLPGTEKEQH